MQRPDQNAVAACLLQMLQEVDQASDMKPLWRRNMISHAACQAKV